MRIASITLRLALFFSAASLMVFLAIGYLIGNAVERHFEEQDLHELHTKLMLIRHALARVRTVQDLDQAGQRLDDALVGHHGLSITVLGPRQRVLFASRDADFPPDLLDSRPSGERIQTTDLAVWSKGGETYRGIAAAAFTEHPGDAPGHRLSCPEHRPPPGIHDGVSQEPLAGRHGRHPADRALRLDRRTARPGSAA